MGGASSGGEDNQVSGYEAAITKQRKGTKKEINKDLNVGTYGERNIDPDRGKTVNQEIAEQNKKNRESRKGLIQKYAENNLLGKLSRSEWSRQKNIKSRKAYAEKIGLDTSLFTDEFMASQGFKDQLDGKGYADRFDPLQANDATKSNEEKAYQAYLTSDVTAPGFSDGTPPDKIAKSEVQPKTETQMDAKKPDDVPKGPTSAEMTQDELLLARKRGRKTNTILTSITGANERASLGRKTLLG